jgi:16S rRNA (uracil1498-N3)-methyltransferase
MFALVLKIIPLKDTPMARKRLFLPDNPSPWTLESLHSLDDADTLHHLLTVQRLKPTDTLACVDAQNQQVFHADIEAIHKKSIVLKNVEVVDLPDTTPTLQVTLYASLLKEQAWDVLLQKACELGIYAIQPILSEFTVIKGGHGSNKQERWQRIVKDAALQCESLYIPHVYAPLTFQDALEQSPSTSFVLLERHDESVKPLSHAVQGMNPHLQVGLWIGAEGGWSPAEKAALLSYPQIKPCHLGNRILRAETASLAGLTLLLHGGIHESN